MSSTAITPQVLHPDKLQRKDIDDSILFRLITSGDSSGLSQPDKLKYYHAICDAYDLDIRGTPFRFIRVQDKEILYATADCSKQLAAKRVITVKVGDEKIVNGIAVAHATASLPNGQSADDIGAVPTENLKGKDLANALMKAVTKAKRRATLSICGIGVPDESELETMETIDIKPLAAPAGATDWLSDKKEAPALPASPALPPVESAPKAEPPAAPAAPPPTPATGKGKADAKGKKNPPPPPRTTASKSAAPPPTQPQAIPPQAPPAAVPPPPAAPPAPPPPVAQAPGSFKFGPKFQRSERVKEIAIVATVNPKHVMDHILRFGGESDFRKLAATTIEAILLATEAFMENPETRQGMASMIANQFYEAKDPKYPAQMELLGAFTTRLKEEKEKLQAVTGRA